MESDPTRICELLVGLPDVNVLGVEDEDGHPLRVHVESRLGRTVAEVARELGCDWHTVNDAVIAYGTPLVDDPGRIGKVKALGLDETLFCRKGRWRTQHWSTSIVDVTPGGAGGQLLDLIPGKSAIGASGWLDARPWLAAIEFGVLDLSGPYLYAGRPNWDLLPSVTPR